MLTIFCMIISYLYTDFLYVYYYKRILGTKYSKKIIFWGTIIFWLLACLMKLVPLFVFGLDITVIVNILMLLLNFGFAIILFSSSVKKRILAVIISMFVQAGMDMLGLNITGIIVGSYDLLQMESEFTVIALFISCFMITLGMIALTKIWQLAERVEWKFSKYEWACMLLPISQIVFVWWAAVRYSVNYESVPGIIISGIVLGFLADVYMFVLFYRLNSRENAEKKLEYLNHQYKLEQVRYEQLKKSQEETAKIRHDFQNYILTMKRME